MGKWLFWCNTPYQILFAANYVYRYPEIEGYVLLTDMIADHQRCAEKIRRSDLFAGVYTVSIKQKETMSMKQTLLSYTLGKSVQEAGWASCIPAELSFDSFCFSNFNYTVTGLWRTLKKRAPAMRTYLFEDGFATYSSSFYATLEKITRPADALHSWSRRQVYEALYHVEGILCFRPELLEWSPAFPCMAVEAFASNDKDFVHRISQAFGYDEAADDYSAKYFFFEEAYFADGKDIGDEALVDRIAALVGKENMFVKIHPRNPVNRFAAKGYKTNQNTSIPWEVIALNLPLQDKVLLTVSSVAVLTPYVLLGLQYRAVMLYKCVEEQSLMYQEMLRTYERICTRTGAVISVPASLDQADQTIRCGVLKG